MMSNNPVSRRTILRGLGVGMALPLLDAMLPAGGLLRVAEAAAASAGSAAKAGATPVRMAMIFVPNGVNTAAWTPSSAGAGWQLSPTLAPLAKVKNELTVLGGLAQNNARGMGDGGGDHARSAAAFLTGAHPVKTNGKDIRNGISIDQLAAQKIGAQTRLPSLELGLDKSQTAGNCDSGYSCAYVTNISWRSDNTPVPKEVDPGAVFDRLFGQGGAGGSKAAAEAAAKRLKYRKSVLDFVAEDSRRLQARIGRADQHKLDEFNTSVREIERRIETARGASSAAALKPDMERPEGIPSDLGEHMRLMADLMVLAFRMDITRISTLMVAREGSNRNFPQIGVTDGHHTISHHQRNEQKLAAIAKIDRYYMEQFAYFIEKLKATPEGNGSLLDNCMILYGSGISDGNRHSHSDLPLILAGRGGGAIKPGRYLKQSDQPMCNLFLSMLDVMGAPTQRFGDSTGLLKGLNG